MVDLGIAGLGPAEHIGGGGSASVFAATRRAFGDRVAVKVLRQTLTDENARRHFEREVRALQELAACPGIVAVLESGVTDDGSPYLMLPLFERSAQAEIDDGTGMDWREATRWAADAARSVHEAHLRGIYHRDLKPANLLLTGSDDVFVTDFGIAVLLETSMSMSGWMGLTPAYAPPESLDGVPASAAGDVYSLGATLVALVTGRPPFTTGEQDTPMAVMRRIADSPAPDLTAYGTPRAIADVVSRAMAKDPFERYASAALLAEALDAARAASTEQSPEPHAPVVDPSSTPAVERGAGAPTFAEGAEPVATTPARHADSTLLGVAADPAPSRSTIPLASLALGVAAVIALVVGLVVVLGGGNDTAPTAVQADTTPETESASGTSVDTTTTGDDSTSDTGSVTPDTGATANGVDDGSLFERVAAADEGAVLELDAGIYELDLPLTLIRDITIRGAGRDQTVIRYTEAAPTIIVTDATVTIEAVAIESTFEGLPAIASPVMTVSDATITIADVEIRNGATSGLQVTNGTGEISATAFRDNNGAGAVFDGTSSIRIEGSEATDNGGSGFVWASTAAGRVTLSTASDNSEHGFLVLGEAAPALEGNTAINNSRHGFTWGAQASGTVSNNIAEGSGWDGFNVQGLARPNLVGNTARDNTESGFEWFERGAGRAADNTSVLNEQHGYALFNEAAPTLERNDAADNEQHGFVWVDQSAGTARLNTSQRNGWDGFNVQGTAMPNLTANDARNNREMGFEWFESGAGSATDNIATANTLGGYQILNDASPTLSGNIEDGQPWPGG